MCWFKKKVIPIPVEPETIEPRSTARINLAELQPLLQKAAPGAEIIMADNWKYLCHDDDIALFLAQDETNKMGYVVDKRDCDDFSYRLMGQFSIPKWSDLAFGICWTDVHALNVFIDEVRRLWFIEPQTDEINEELATWQGQVVSLIVM